MSIAIQAIVSPQAATVASSPVTQPTAMPHYVEKSTQVSIGNSEFQQGTRNARIKLLASGEHGVLCYDASADYNELLIRQSVQAAVEAAEAWVKHKF